MPEPLASVIVPASNVGRTLARTLAALAAQTLDGGFEVIVVVDDGSTDKTEEIARLADPPVSVVCQPSLGVAAARNIGVREARGPLLAFCDADVFPTAGWLEAGVRALQHVDLVQGKVLPDPDAPLGPFDRTIWITSAAGLWETANLFVRRELIARTGGFEQWVWPRSGGPFGEDALFAYRALRAGASASFCAEALAYHAVFARDWRGYVHERSRLEYFPAMAARMPELRDRFFYRRVFLNGRTARLDLALAGAALALGFGSALPLVTAAPYLRMARAHARRAQPLGPSPGAVLGADVAADLVGLAAMLWGSVRYRSAVV